MTSIHEDKMDVDSELDTEEDDLGDDEGQGESQEWQRDLGRLIGNICQSPQTTDRKEFLRRWGRTMRNTFVYSRTLDGTDYEFVRFLLVNLQHAVQDPSSSIFVSRNGQVTRFRLEKYDASNIIASLPSMVASRAHLTPSPANHTLSPSLPNHPRDVHRHHSSIEAPTPPSVPAPPTTLTARISDLRASHRGRRHQLKARHSSNPPVETHLPSHLRSPPRSVPSAGNSLNPNALQQFSRPHANPQRRTTTTVDEAAEAFNNVDLNTHFLGHRGGISCRRATMYELK